MKAAGTELICVCQTENERWKRWSAAGVRQSAALTTRSCSFLSGCVAFLICGWSSGEACRDVSHRPSPWRRALLSCCPHAELLHACLDRCAASFELRCLHNQWDFTQPCSLVHFVGGCLETPVVLWLLNDLKASLASMTTQTNTNHTPHCFLFPSCFSFYFKLSCIINFSNCVYPFTSVLSLVFWTACFSFPPINSGDEPSHPKNICGQKKNLFQSSSRRMKVNWKPLWRRSPETNLSLNTVTLGKQMFSSNIIVGSPSYSQYEFQVTFTLSWLVHTRVSNLTWWLSGGVLAVSPTPPQPAWHVSELWGHCTLNADVFLEGGDVKDVSTNLRRLQISIG